MAFSLFSKTPNWWEYTCLSWFCSVVAFYLTFWVNVVVYELFTVWELVKNHYRDNNNRDLSNLEILHRFILMRQISFYGGGAENHICDCTWYHKGFRADRRHLQEVVGGRNGNDQPVALLARHAIAGEDRPLFPGHLATIKKARNERTYLRCEWASAAIHHQDERRRLRRTDHRCFFLLRFHHRIAEIGIGVVVQMSEDGSTTVRWETEMSREMLVPAINDRRFRRLFVLKIFGER